MKVVEREHADSLLTLVRMGKARVVKELKDNGRPVYSVFSASGTPCGIISKKFEYLFEAVLISQGNGDGLLEGCSQTAARAK